MKSQTLLLIAIVAAFLVASESVILTGGGCPKCYRESGGRCRKILGCYRKRGFLEKFYEMPQDMPRNNMQEVGDYIPEDY